MKRCKLLLGCAPRVPCVRIHTRIHNLQRGKNTPLVYIHNSKNRIKVGKDSMQFIENFIKLELLKYGKS